MPTPMPPVINPWSMEAIGAPLAFANYGHNAHGSAVYPSADVAIFIPFIATERIIVAQLFSSNGTVAGTDNIDVGIYDETGVRLISSTPTLHAGTSTIQAFNITDTELGPGLFYLAVAMSGVTATLQRGNVPAEYLRACGVFQQAGLTAGTLPAVATFATMAQSYCPYVGFTQRSVI